MTNSVTTWGAGDYPAMARRLEPAALTAVDMASVAAGDHVVDVACGTGNAAVLAALRGARVVGVDFEPALLGVAEQRAAQLGLDVQWVQGDLAALPLPDRSADVVLSIFGVMYAADHVIAAGELARVARAESRIVLASWLPGSVMPAMGQVLSGYLPSPPASSGPPSRWGDSAELSTLLASCGLWLTATRRERIILAFLDAEAAVDFLVDTAGHVVSHRQRLVAEGRWDAFRCELLDFVRGQNVSRGDQLDLPLEYLLASATPAAGR